MSNEEIDAIETILVQCQILHSHSQKILALRIILCIREELRNQAIELKGSDD